MTQRIFSLLVTLFLTVSQYGKHIEGYMVDRNPHHRRETLDSEGKYQLEWKVDWPSKQITFNVTVETRGYVGFGLSASGKMSGADIVIGGVTPAGKPYFSDRHAVGNHLPEVDPSQHWKLIEARENRSHTFLSFSRPFDTCDSQDYPITEDKIALIWAFGEKDNNIEYHHRNRGSYYIFLLHPDYTPPITRDPITGAPIRIGNGDSDDIKVWTISRTFTMPTDETNYFCTMHAAPNISTKHHMIGFDVRFPNKADAPVLHHADTYRCHVPKGLNRSPQSVFGPFVGHRGQQCYLLSAPPKGPIPTDYCTEIFHAHSQGGRVTFQPSHVGMPLFPGDYFALQSHYHNPNREAGRVIEFHIDFYYTSKLRANDLGLLVQGKRMPGLPISVLLPPSSIEQTIHGHCSEGCTKAMIPKQGIKIVTSLLHSHTASRRVKLQHFRGDRELPWVQSDDNFKFEYQQIQVMNKEVLVLPGDQLTMTCSMDNTLSNGSSIGGFSGNHEMCVSFDWYYNRMENYGFCWSDQDSLRHRRRFLAGVTNVTWHDEVIQYTVDAPHRLAGLTVKEVSDNHVNWNLAKREEIEAFHRTHPQEVYCSPRLYSQGLESVVTVDPPTDVATYPFRARPYVPPMQC